MFIPQENVKENGQHTNGNLVQVQRGTKAKAVYDSDGNSYTAKDLDDAIVVVQQLARDQIVSNWHIGKKVAEIYDKGLWKTRGAYQTFDDFAKAELPVKPVTALRWMNIARTFTEAEAQDKPVELLRELATLEDTDAKSLLRAYTSNEITAPEARKKAKELKKANKGDAGPKKKPGVAEANMARTSTEERITIQMPSAKKHYVLNAKAVKGEDPRPAHSLDELPWVQIPCQRGVYLMVQVSVNKDGSLRLTAQPIRT